MTCRSANMHISTFLILYLQEDVIPYYKAYHCLGAMLEDSKYKVHTIFLSMATLYRICIQLVVFKFRIIKVLYSFTWQEGQRQLGKPEHC